MKKYSFIILLTVFVMMITCTSTYAAERTGYSTKPTEGRESPYTNYGSDFHIVIPGTITEATNSSSTTSQGIITTYGTKIVQQSSGYIYGYCTCNANQIVTQIGYSIYFQMWDGYKWVNIDSAASYRNNIVFIEGYHFKYVTPNQYYRVMTNFYVIDNGMENTQTATSDYILVY